MYTTTTKEVPHENFIKYNTSNFKDTISKTKCFISNLSPEYNFEIG